MERAVTLMVSLAPLYAILLPMYPTLVTTTATCDHARGIQGRMLRKRAWRSKDFFWMMKLDYREFLYTSFFRSLGLVCRRKDNLSLREQLGNDYFRRQDNHPSP